MSQKYPASHCSSSMHSSERSIGGETPIAVVKTDAEGWALLAVGRDFAKIEAGTKKSFNQLFQTLVLSFFGVALLVWNPCE